MPAARVWLGPRSQFTLIFGSWDGEEVGLTGSTEWGEQFSEELRTKLVAYLNVDSSASGPNFHGGASGSLAPMLVETSYSIEDPGGGSLHDAWLKSTATERKQEHKSEPVRNDNVVNTRIGSGSDHTVFLNFLGRPVITLEFDGPYGVYHSMYDDYFWMNHFGDPATNITPPCRSSGALPPCECEVTSFRSISNSTAIPSTNFSPIGKRTRTSVLES